MATDRKGKAKAGAMTLAGHPTTWGCLNDQPWGLRQAVSARFEEPPRELREKEVALLIQGGVPLWAVAHQVRRW
jgi:hypothetical protein